MSTQNRLFILIATTSMFVSCTQQSSSEEAVLTSQTEENNISDYKIPEFNEDELIDLFHQTESDGIQLPKDKHSGENRYQIDHPTFNELLIEYESTNININGDSLASFIIRSNDISIPEKRIVYDFGLKPGNYGDMASFSASYTRQQLQDRWYFEEISFD